MSMRRRWTCRRRLRRTCVKATARAPGGEEVDMAEHDLTTMVRNLESETISINRAPVLTLWAAVVAQRLGFDEDEALTLGKAVAGLNAQSKGRRLGRFKPHEEKPHQARERERGEEFWIELCGRPLPARNTE